MLLLEVEYLSGVCFARSPEGEEVEWPPQPARIFSALVAAWGARGQRDDERSALEWLECQEPPMIEASDAFARTAVIAYVPPNSVTNKIGKLSKMPSHRGRQPRSFPAARPVDPVVKFRWQATAAPPIAVALDRLARDVVYLGHSSSLVRVRCMNVDGDEPRYRGELPTTVVYRGRLAELERAFQAQRFPSIGQPGVGVVPPPKMAESFFDHSWLVLRDAGGQPPAPQAIAIVGKRMRDALMAGLGSRGETIPSWLSGHQTDGGVLQKPHLAVVPMLEVGWEHSVGRLMGLALVLPRHAEGASRDDLDRVLNVLLETSAEGVIGLRFKTGSWLLEPVEVARQKSLSTERWVAHERGAVRWASATPIVLDRHPKATTAAGRQEETAALVAAACEQIGLPRPLSVFVDKYSAVAAALPAYPPSTAPAWTGFALTPSLRGRPLTHAVLEFAEPVAGPVLLGAGRYVGLGMCLPLPAVKVRR